MFLKLFIPTWKFFDQLGTVSNLFYRELNKTGDGPWMPVFDKPKRNFLNLFYNPEGNLYLACVALVDRLVHEVGTNHTLSPQDIEQLESFLLVKNLVLVFLQEKKSKGFRFQFKIQVQSEKTALEDFLVSKKLVL